MELVSVNNSPKPKTHKNKKINNRKDSNCSSSSSSSFTKESSDSSLCNELKPLRKEHKVGSVHEVEEDYMKQDYIIHGYRINFDSAKKIFRSLFMVHNESINVWTHLVGSIVIVVFIFYTAVFIHYHKEIITDFDFTKLKGELKQLTEPILPSISQYATSFYNTTMEYVSLADEKISEYKDYINLKINCLSCAEEVIKYLSEIKESITSKININFSEELQQILDIIKIKELQWLNFYSKSAETHKDEVYLLPKWPLYIMLLGGVICLSFSANFHLFIAHSERLNNLFNRLDYAGIAFLIVGSIYPPCFYLFNCDIKFAYIYLTFITVLGAIVFIISIREEFTKREYHKLKGSLFLAFGISAGFPLFHLNLFKVNGFDWYMYDFTLWFIGGLSYIIGALIYILRIPERLRPGRFCIIGNSHQIFHIMVLIGVFTHYYASVESYIYRSQNSCN